MLLVLRAIAGALLLGSSVHALLALNYTTLRPAPTPPGGGCIVVARVYQQKQTDGKMLPVLWDSAPICVSEAGPNKADTSTFTDNQALPNIDLSFVAYGYVGGDDTVGRMLPTTKAVGCIFPKADTTKPCLRKHWALPQGVIMVNPFNKTAGHELWVQPRSLTSEPMFTPLPGDPV